MLIWKGKTGVDKGCQIEDGDLFNFDEEVQPLVHIIVSKTLEESRREVLEEEELRHIREQQEKYQKLNNMNKDKKTSFGEFLKQQKSLGNKLRHSIEVKEPSHENNKVLQKFNTI